jgi:hypothetical protein
MRKLSQKELVGEGIGTFMKKAGKGALSVAGSVLGGLARAASPTAAGLVDKTRGAFSNTMNKAKAAMSTPEERITDYFKEMGYKVVDNGINPGVTDDTKVVKVSEIVYDDEGAGKEVPVSSPFVVKVEKGGVKVIRGPRFRQTAQARNEPRRRIRPAAPAQPAAPAAAASPPVTNPAAQTPPTTQPAAAAAGARGQQGPRAAKSESPEAAKKRIVRAIKSNRPPSKSDIEMLKKAGVKGDQTIGGVKFSALKRRTNLAESRKSQKNLLKHLHYGSQMNK